MSVVSDRLPALALKLMDLMLKLVDVCVRFQSTKESAEEKRKDWARHVRSSSVVSSPVPQWLGSLLAPMRMILFFFVYTSTNSNSQ